MFRVAMFSNAHASYRASLIRDVKWGCYSLLLVAAFALPSIRF